MRSIFYGALTLFILLLLISSPLLGSSDPDRCIHCPEYVALPAHLKLSTLWKKIESTAYKEPYPPMIWPKLKLLGLFDESMNTTFDLFSDQYPTNRKRIVHTYGSIGRISWMSHVTHEHKYTGIYRTGTMHGLMRLSLAADPAVAGFIPGFAIKFLQNRQYSANLIGMYEVFGTGYNFNFFSVPLKTKIKVPAVLSATHILDKTFGRGAEPANILAVDTPSLYDNQGYHVTNPKYPAMLYLVPSLEIRAKKFSVFPHDFRKDLASIEKGTILYEVYATEKECNCGKDPCKDIFKNKERCKAELIATIRAESPFIPSKFGDESIFFQHSRWNKEQRQTCIYSQSLDVDNRDSTVIASNPRADCQVGVKCADKDDNMLISKISGCPYDTYLKSMGKTPDLPKGHPVLRSIETSTQ